MNTNKNIEKPCTHGEELVSYLYGEMPEDGRTQFENHLAGCDACTGEFAGLSLARLSVYEWHRDEFAAIPTPRIVIPYETIEQVSWLESWFGPIFAAPKLAVAGGAFAVIVAALGFVLFSSNGLDNNIASDIKPVETPVAVQDKSANVPNPEDKQLVEVKEAKPLIIKNDNPYLRPLKTSGLPAQARKRKVNAQLTAASKRPAAKLTAPRLTNFEDEPDTTLRLADLIADIDTND